MSRRMWLINIIRIVVLGGMVFTIVVQQKEIQELSKVTDTIEITGMEQDENDEQEVDAYHYEVQDDEYKMFYGKWEIVEFMGISKYCPGDKQEETIGHYIYYDNEKMEIDGEIVVESPTYMCGIIPCKYSHFYTEVKPADMESTALVWGNKEDYFVHVKIEQLKDKEGNFIKYGRTFYIVDEDTLIIDIDDGWYRMERVSYIEGYPENIQ